MSVPQGKAKSIFLNAVEIPSVSERQAYLVGECGGDEALRREVEGLLEHHAGMGSFLESAAPGPPVATVDGAIGERPGTVIGPYKLLEQIGEGGFGVVFLAEQTEPVRRNVALKVLKPGMDSRQVVARFEAERQALALMDHPHIAQVHDGGTTADGRPFFVMELVKGIPVTDYCDQCSLTTRERLDLFLSVCQAVQHAHQKGVIHRDLKPSNVLVAIPDGQPMVKVIDFGVAKAINQRLSEHTLVTGFRQLIGTPLYMSPEQAEMSPLDVDSRADIYALGVLLYELLTGTTPFEKERFKEASYDELRRIIREEEAPRPSARLSTLKDKLTTVAEQRRTDPRQLLRTVKGELDWIVMKALEKDRNRRYETANDFAMDVQRYLADEPVLACPPSRLYRLKKLVPRNKVALLTTLLVAVSLLAGTAISLWQVVRARQAEQDARKNADWAEANFQKSLEAVEVLTQVGYEELSDTPHLAHVRRALLEKALAFQQGFLDERSDDPKVQFQSAVASLRAGALHGQLGEHKAAEEAYRRGVDRLVALAEGEPSNRSYRLELAAGRVYLGGLLRHIGRLKEAEQELREAVAVQEDLAKADSLGAKAVLGRARAFNGLGWLLDDTGRLAEAEGYFKRALAVLQRLAGEHPQVPKYQADLAQTHRSVAGVHRALKQFGEAEEHYQRAIEIARQLAASHPRPGYRLSLAMCIHDYGLVLDAKGDHDRSEKLCREAIVIKQELVDEFPSVYGARRDLAASYNFLAVLHARRGEFRQSEELHRRTIAVLEKPADYHPNVAEYQQALGTRANSD